MQRLARRQARRQRLLTGAALLTACLSLGAFALPGIIGFLALLWQAVSRPSLLSHGAKLLAQLFDLARSLGGACWLVMTALFSSLNQLALLGYSILVLALTALWIRLVAGRQVRYWTMINK